MKKIYKTFLVCLLICGIATNGFAQSKEGKNKISRLLIIVLVGNAENRQTFEDEIQIQLGLMGYGSKQSHNTTLHTGEKITKEDVLKVVKENNYDGVLVLKMLDVSEDMSYSSDRPDYTAGIYFNSYAYNYYQQNWDVVKDLRVVIRTDLFLVEDQSLIFSETSGRLKVDQAEEFIGKFTKKLVKKLEKGGYLSKMEK